MNRHAPWRVLSVTGGAMWSDEAAMMRGDARPAGGHRLGRRDRDGGARRRDRRCPPWRTFDDLRALSWQQFEEIIADAFRRHGDRVQETGWAGPPRTVASTWC
jgi:hypothetical protein